MAEVNRLSGLIDFPNALFLGQEAPLPIERRLRRLQPHFNASEKKNSYPCRELKHDSSDVQSVAQSLYRLGCPSPFSPTTYRKLSTHFKLKSWNRWSFYLFLFLRLATNFELQPLAGNKYGDSRDYLTGQCTACWSVTVSYISLWVAQLVGALHYKPEGRAIRCRWGDCDFSLT
jgi:hypothetical protein